MKVINKIEYECECKNPHNDVLAKVSQMDEKTGKPIVKIVTKCLGCGKQHFLNENDKRCEPFFNKKTEDLV